MTNRIIVAIDPGTHCGYAIRTERGFIVSGTWDLRVKRGEGAGMRFVRFRKHFSEILVEAANTSEGSGGVGYPGVVVAFEEVMRHMGTDAAHIYGGITSHIFSICEDRKVPYFGIPVGTIKKFATGKGNADKEKMLAAAAAKWPDHKCCDDNEADALWIAEYAWTEHGKA